MLSPEDLNGALVYALKTSDSPCSKWCRAVAERDESTYHIWHNGTGSADTADCVVHSAAVLAMAREPFSERLKLWIAATHKHERFDLNGAV